MMGFSVVLFVCLFGLEPADTQHGVVAAEGVEGGGMKGAEERLGMGLLDGDVGHADLPARRRVTCRAATGQSCSTNTHKLQDQGNKRPRAASDPSADFFRSLSFFTRLTAYEAKCIIFNSSTILILFKSSFVTNFAQQQNYSRAEHLCDMIIFSFLNRV